MKNLNCFLFGIILISSSLNSCSQSEIQDTIKPEEKPASVWNKLADGIEVLEMDAPKKSIIGDSKITIVKIDPEMFEFQLLTATEHKRISRPVNEWADTFNLNVVLNAGMYELSNGLINRGYMKNYAHFNNPVFNPAYNSMIALNPVDSLNAKFVIFDLKCDNWESVKSDYNSFAQGMRMIDCNGEPLGWNKKNQSCSMLVAATDSIGNIYYIFSRSPYTHNQMISFIIGFPFELTNAIYLEGGPETSLYIKVGDTVIEKVGSYVSQTYAHDNNKHFWKLPNVIGLRLKEGN